jgi:hypothetical protein
MKFKLTPILCIIELIKLLFIHRFSLEWLFTGVIMYFVYRSFRILKFVPKKFENFLSFLH